jgi:chromosome partitioning protein
MIDGARERRRDQIEVILVSNRFDCCTIEGRQLAEELSEFGEIAALPPPLPVVRHSSAVSPLGQSIANFVPGTAPDQEIQQVADAVERAVRKE